MKYELKLGAAMGVMLAQLPTAMAQDAGTTSDPVDLGDIEIVEQVETSKAPVAYESFDPIDSGTVTIGASSINAENQGDINTTELLRKAPNIQLSATNTTLGQRDIQEVRPSDFTISGGNYYNNNIMIDGVQANSVMDVTNTSAAHYNEVAGQTAQTFYVDPSLLGEIIVRDSNVSAQYGDFTGGVVDFVLREPDDKFSVSVTSSYQDDSFFNYKVGDEFADDDDLPAEPSFTKLRYAISADVPVNEKLKLLASYSRTESTVDYEFSERYFEEPYENGSTSQNFLLKGVYDVSDTLKIDGQIAYSPYESEYSADNRIDDLLKSHSDGLSAYLKASGQSGETDWQARVSYGFSDASRDWKNSDHFSWRSTANFVDWCTSTNCSQGGFGDIDQIQNDFAFDFDASRPMWGGELSGGVEIKLVDVEKSRLRDNNAYSRGTVSDTISCPTGDVACIENDVVLLQKSVYQAYEADAEVSSEAAWAEFEKSFDDIFTLRAGLRYSHDDFLDNHNLAPRLTGSWEVRPDWFLTLGANRYYAKNMVGYAIRSQYPDSYIYRRTLGTDGVVSDWALYRHTRSSDYAQANLNTPYSDEITAALTVPTPLNGNFRLKTVVRDSEDSFARSPSDTVSFDAPTATSSTTRVYTITNDGNTEYEAISAEWTGSLENHAFTANVTVSDTTTRGGIEDYFDEIDNEELLEDLLYYNGDIITEEELNNIRARSDFATPVTASLIWSSTWFEERLNTTVGAYYRGEYESIVDTGDNITLDGVRYDIYDIETLDAHTGVNLNAQIELFDNDAAGQGVLDVRVDNLFDSLPHTITTSSKPYQAGRSFWVGFSYKY